MPCWLFWVEWCVQVSCFGLSGVSMLIVCGLIGVFRLTIWVMPHLFEHGVVLRGKDRDVAERYGLYTRSMTVCS